MRSFDITIDEKLFNLLWRSISEREGELEHNIEHSNEDNAALIGNDLVYLRLCKKELKDKAESSNFTDGAFSLEEEYIDLSDL